MSTSLFRTIITALLTVVYVIQTQAAGETETTDSIEKGRTVHRIEAVFKPSAILHTNDYLNGNNPEKRTMNHAMSYHLKYAFSAAEGSREAALYPGAYQGVGVSWNEFNPQLGNPVAVYIFQGARIAKIARRLSLNYEWNLGIAYGWNPYNKETNRTNISIGSKATAYINVDLYLRWMISRCWDLNIGGSLTHFSNGNTSMPNFGLNVAGGMLSLAYYVNRTDNDNPPARRYSAGFKRSVTCDVLLYGAWRQRAFYDGYEVMPIDRKDPIIGFNINPMYNINPWLNAGISLDGEYDRSSNLVPFNGPYDKGDDYKYPDYVPPKASRQMTLGLSARAEFVMPYFTINMGVGTNVVNAKKDFSGVYEVLALKLNVTRRVFLHIGYSLYDLKKPNHLMLGVGWRFGRIAR